MSYFKRFIEFILEKKKSDKHAIEQVSPEYPPVDPSIALVCPKCGESAKVCDCYLDDYYNAKNPQWNPKAKTIKPKKNEKD